MIRRSVAAALLGMLLPAAAWAQAGIAGVVKDTTGAVLPGATVEASSPALIEKIRTVVTDGEGQYKIVDLRPGTYTVTFTLPGFNTVTREGIELVGRSTATVSAELRVGTVAESVTVSGASPLIDAHNVLQQKVITREALDSLPNAKNYNALMVLVPGLAAPNTRTDVGGSNGETFVRMAIYGGRSGEDHKWIDGLRLNNIGASGGANSIFINAAAVQEIALDVANLPAEYAHGGIQINIIPKEGGNAFSGFFLAAGTNENFQSNNLTADLESRGLTSRSSVKNVWDVNGAFGGPVLRDRLWFFTAHRAWGNINYVPGRNFNKDVRAWTYTPDLSRPAIDQTRQRSDMVNMTWQANPKNKINFYYDNQYQCYCYFGMVLQSGGTAPALSSPEAVPYYQQHPNYHTHVKWSATVTNRLLLEGGAGFTYFGVTQTYQDGVTPDLVSVTELSTNFAYRAAPSYGASENRTYNERFTATYVTGSHAVKTGVVLLHGVSNSLGSTTNRDMTFQFFNGIPRAVVLRATPFNPRSDLKADLGVFAQDQWTMNRLTLNMGLRFSYLNAYNPPRDVPAGTFMPARSYPEVGGVPIWKDLTPRLGVAYDLFGNGKTAVKAGVYKYVQGETVTLAGAANPQSTISSSASRTWTDNGNFVPDCDLLNPALNGECGPLTNTNFGKNVVTTTYDPDYLHGWGKRTYNWQTSASIQHELRQGLSVNAAYYRRWYGNLLVNENQAVSPGDYDPYCLTAPADSRLPGGGGNQICGLYDINPSKFGRVQNFVTLADDYGNMIDKYDGVDVSVNARFPHGAFVQGGVNFGRELTDNCDLVGKVDNGAGNLLSSGSGVFTAALPTNASGLASPSARFCRIDPPFLAQVKLAGSYPLPWWGVVTSATFQSLPGAEVTATWSVPNALVVPSLNRNLSAGAAGFATVQLVSPGTLYEDRIMQLDLRLSKIISVNRARVQGNFDLYNLFNGSGILGENNQYGPNWRQPFSILAGRLLKFGVQFTF